MTADGPRRGGVSVLTGLTVLLLVAGVATGLARRGGGAWRGVAAGAPPQDLPVAASPLEIDPAEVAMSVAALDSLDRAILEAVADSATPGAALAVGRHGRLVRLRGYGHLDRDGARTTSPTTVYDLASLTKVVGTTTAVMLLVDRGELDLDERVIDHLPGWDRGDPRKARVTLRDLLLHRSGLPPFRRWFFEIEGPEAYADAMDRVALDFEPGERTQYSDIGFMTLGRVVEAVAGTGLDDLLRTEVFAPLGMTDTRFRPPESWLDRIAPTEVDTVFRHVHVRGEVHDENAWAMGGVAGHAGLFSTARDLSIFAGMMAAGGAVPPCEPGNDAGVPCTAPRPDSVRLLRHATVERFTRRHDESSSRALGWDTPSGRSSAGDFFGPSSFGHTGFTGTSLWMDPELDLFVVLLTNRVNPTRDNPEHVPLRRTVHDLAARAVTDRPVRPREERTPR